MDLRIKNIVLLIIDTLLINIAIYVSLLLRFDGLIPHQYLHSYIYMMPFFTLITLGSLIGFKLYNRVWEYAGVDEAGALLQATTISMLAVAAAIYALHLPLLPRSIYIMSWFLMTVLLGASRISWRLMRAILIRQKTHGARRVLIIGAGDAGAMLAREIRDNVHLKLRVIGFIDDDKHKHHLRLHNLPILGGREEIAAVVSRNEINEIIIAMPSVSRIAIKEIIHICKQTSANLRILPNIYASTNGSSMVTHLREVRMEDLLGRDPVVIDLERVSCYLKDKTVLVTGGGGSIGSELCRQVIRFKPFKLIIVDCCENNLFDIEMEMKSQNLDIKMAIELVDVRNRIKLEKIFKKHRPQVIFHAAAFKHVPMMERHPEEALHNNVIGTRNVAEMADKFQTEVFILISTDKAVNPSSVMGATKRIAELIIKDINRTSSTRLAAVRFGNVLGSRGSVIPTFMRQIAQGGPITVTHPDMTRFFMTIPEAVELVIEAGALTEGGETFVLDMGNPVKIADLARDLIELSGYVPDQDIQISYTGIRPGEKLYEELFLGGEEMACTSHERIFISTQELDENYTGINKNITHLVKKALADRNLVLRLIKSIVPEYHKPDYTGLKTASSGEVIYMDKRENKAKIAGSAGN